MRTYTEELTGCELTEYTKEESENKFGPIKKQIFYLLGGVQCVQPLNDNTETLFRNSEWPCLIFPQNYTKLKRDTLYDGSEAGFAALVEGYGERDDSTWYRDDITPFLYTLAARGTKKIQRWSFQGNDHVVEVPVTPYIAQNRWIDRNSEIDDVLPGEWILHDDFEDWGLYSDDENFCILGGAEPLMHAYIDKVGGWSAFRDYIDREFEFRMKWNTQIWYIYAVRCLYRIARWSWPFGEIDLSDGRPYEPYEPYEPLAD